MRASFYEAGPRGAVKVPMDRSEASRGHSLGFQAEEEMGWVSMETALSSLAGDCSQHSVLQALEPAGSGFKGQGSVALLVFLTVTANNSTWLF
jgi:hypothetical protein